MKRIPLLAAAAVLFCMTFSIFAETKPEQAQILLAGPVAGKAYSITVTEKEIKAKTLSPENAYFKSFLASPSGKWLAQVEIEGQTELWLGDTASAKHKPLACDRRAFRDPLTGALSPSGDRICFGDSKKAFIKRISVEGKPDPALLPFEPDKVGGGLILAVNLETGRPELVFSYDGYISPPGWSPDGKRIAYYYGGKEALIDDSYAVGVSVFDDESRTWSGTEVAPPSLHGGLPGPSRQFPPRWSSGGGFLRFYARYETNDAGRGLRSYYVADAAGSEVLKVDDLEIKETPARPSGDYVVYQKDGYACAVDFEAKVLRRIYKCIPKKRYVRRAFSPDGRWFAYAPEEERSIAIARWDGKEERTALSVKKGYFSSASLVWVTALNGKSGSADEKND